MPEAFKSNQTYYFRIKIIVGPRYTDYSNIVSGRESSTYAPSDFRAQEVKETFRRLDWQDNSTSESGFKIYRRTGNSGDYPPLALVPANTTNYTDSTVIVTDTTYCYKICSVFSNGTSSGFDTLSILLPFSPPNDLKLVGLSS